MKKTNLLVLSAVLVFSFGNFVFAEDDILSEVEDFFNSINVEKSTTADSESVESPALSEPAPETVEEASSETVSAPKSVAVPEESSEVEDISAVEYSETEEKSVVYDEVYTADETEDSEDLESEEEKIDYLKIKVEIPPKKRPKKGDPEKIKEAERKDSENEDFEKNQKAIKYGTPQEISGVVDKIVKEEDQRYIEELYDLFYVSSSNEIKQKLLEYFGKLEDSCLESFAVEVIDDPYDMPNSLVEACFNYVQEVGSKAAGPALVKLMEAEEDKYFDGALRALGKTGGTEEAKYLAQYLKRDDLTVPQRQSLMRTLGAMCAVETYDELVEIIKDDDENSFVRMYACEAIGKMKKEGAVKILKKYFEEGDPNMRQYCIKGLSNFPKNDDANAVIIQGIRDNHYKVRIESIKAAKELDLKAAVEYLAYRAKNDSENAVKKECFPVIASLNTKEGNAFLLEQITDKKVPDSVKLMSAEALMERGTFGENEIIELAKEVVKDDRRKPLRQGLGKLFIKYARPGYAEIDVLYLRSKDSLTISQGLDLYKAGKYEIGKPVVLEIAEEKTTKSSLRKVARKILGLPDEEEKKEDADAKEGKKVSSSASEEK